MRRPVMATGSSEQRTVVVLLLREVTKKSLSGTCNDVIIRIFL